MAAMRAPTSTYRLQFGGGFGLAEAAAVLPYLARLCISDVYASPLLAARPQSTHGYDVTDPTRVNPALGGEEGFAAFSARLRENDLGLLLDIVPNHMAAHRDNRWWWDVLLRGRESPHAEWFDIDWERGGGRVVLPVLAGPPEEVLRRGELTIDADRDPPEFVYFEHRFPLAGARPGEKADVAGLLGRQHYELIHWREGPRRVNYRRFFDIGDLVGVRPEVSAQFEASHARIARMASEGQIAGVRVDHIDGLASPEEYLAGLFEALDQGEGAPYIVVEKILGPDEEIPFGSATAGTTGYDVLNLLNALWVDEDGYRSIREDARKRLDLREFADEAVACKRRAIERLFPGDLAALAGVAAAAVDRPAAPIAEALAALTASLSVYRTYFEPGRIREEDLDVLRAAEDDAADRNPELADDIGRLVDLVCDPEQKHHAFILRWQQFTGPVMAKGVEDTALYRHTALVSLNEVGGHPGSVAGAVERLHEKTAGIRRFGRTRMNATSTHDTKRSEDVRARISAISEFPDLWIPALDRLLRANSAATLRDRVLLMQTLVGVWPLEGKPDAALGDRVAEYMVKAAREAGLETSWTDPDAAYESSLREAAGAMIAAFERSEEARAVLEAAAFFGALNSLSQTLLKLTMTGVPDIYQGSELWDFSLVDPDNRRPVDFALRERLLAGIEDRARADREGLFRELLGSWRDGRIKQYLTWTLLRARREDRKLFLEGTYLPLRAAGDHHERIVAFERRYPDRSFIAIGTRLLSPVLLERTLPADPAAWASTFLELPGSAPRAWRDLFSGRTLAAGPFGIPLAEAFALAPFAALEPA